MRAFALSLLLLITPPVLSQDLTISLGGQVFQVDTAVSAKERARGLMYETSMPKDQGMLFIYSEPYAVSFWMKDTYIPLDILFFDKEGSLVKIHSNAQPCKRPPCKMYSSKNPVSYVLELNGGIAKKLNLKSGDKFEILEQ